MTSGYVRCATIPIRRVNEVARRILRTARP
mgnify:CR=1 FL=1